MKLVALVGVAAALQAPRCSRTQRTKLSATRDGAQRRRLLVGGGGAVLLSPLQKALALPAAAAPRVVCDGFAVAATDDRKYRLVELASGMRVLLAINSEHSKNLKSDAFRVYQLEKSLFPAAHPFSKFGTGNRTTLRPPDGTGEPPRGALVEFYGEHYRSLTLKWIVPFEGEDAAAVQASRLRDRFAKPDLFLSHVLATRARSLYAI
ncbi:M16 peptidase-like protein [Aureococcus anophagefferens]|nr:M16 peptidase-like protein [Aureococcus anophagefferens]